MMGFASRPRMNANGLKRLNFLWVAKKQVSLILNFKQAKLEWERIVRQP